MYNWVTIQQKLIINQHFNKIKKKLHPHKNLHTDIYSSFIPGTQTWKQPRGPSVVKCTMVPPDFKYIGQQAGTNSTYSKN